jgi:hypothetical protein
MRFTILALLSMCVLVFSACSPDSSGNARAPVVWKLDNVGKIGGLKAEALDNAPSVVNGALHFDGKSQGLLLPAFPVAGWKAFTIELEIFPEAGGGFEQRFFHGGTGGGRAMVELRSKPDGSWYLDTHITGDNGNRVTLIDEKKTYPSGRWYTIRLVYDGETMSHYVDGVKEGEGRLAVAPLPAGAVSLGVRQNKVSWFKGAMREVRFWPEARR